MMEFPATIIVEELFKEVDDVTREPESNWKYVGDEGPFRVVRKMSKVTGVLNVPVASVINLLDDFPSRMFWDPMCKCATLVQQSGPVQIHHLELLPLPLISSRDIVYYTSSRVSPTGEYIGVSRSLPHSTVHLPPKKDVVRMEIVLSGTKLEPVVMADGTQATKVTLIGITDPKGFIPSFNLKTVAMKSASLLCNMQTYLYNQQSKSVQSG